MTTVVSACLRSTDTGFSDLLKGKVHFISQDTRAPCQSLILVFSLFLSCESVTVIPHHCSQPRIIKIQVAAGGRGASNGLTAFIF